MRINSGNNETGQELHKKRPISLNHEVIRLILNIRLIQIRFFFKKINKRIKH